MIGYWRSIVDKIDEARELLNILGMPKAQQADICCYVLLAMAGIKQSTAWVDAKNEWIRIHDMIQFANTYYGLTYAENSRKTFRKRALHHFRNAALVARKIFVTAFLDFKTYKRFSEALAWETEVWIAEMPEHMIHLNGDKFLGPR